MNDQTGRDLTEAVYALSKVLHDLGHQQTSAVLHQLAHLEHKIMATQTEIVADLKVANTQLRKLVADTAGQQAAVDALKAQIVQLEALVAAGGTISQELVDAVAETKALTQTVDDNVPELPAPPVA